MLVSVVIVCFWDCGAVRRRVVVVVRVNNRTHVLISLLSPSLSLSYIRARAKTEYVCCVFVGVFIVYIILRNKRKKEKGMSPVIHNVTPQVCKLD